MKDQSIVTRFEALKSDRSEVEGLWRLMERYIMPLRSEFYGQSAPGSKPNWRRREVYDATAPDAAGALAASLQGHLISPAVKWFDFRFNKDSINGEDEAREWLELASSTAFYSLQQSNFNLQAGESFLDLVTFGNTVLIEESNEEGDLDFTSVPIRECFFEEGSKNQVVTFYRRLLWTAVQIKDHFPGIELPGAVQASLDSDSVTELDKFEIVFCVYERPESETGQVDLSKPVPPKNLPFGYKYILIQGKELLGEEGGYFEMPAYIIRWRTKADSKWGYGPGAPILSTILGVNQWVEALIVSAEKMLEPPFMTTQRGLIGDLDLRRGGLTVVADMNELAPLPVGGDLQAGIYNIQDDRDMIRRAFFEDQLSLKESPAMTATEVNVRYELMQRMLGPTLGRLQSDFLDPMLSRTLAILLRAGRIPPPPESAMTDGIVDVEYIGPLPRSQKKEQAAAMLGWAGQISTMSELHPELNDIPNWDILLTMIGTNTGVPAKAINSPDEIKDIRNARAEQQRKMREAEEQKATGEALKSVGQGLQESAAGVDAAPPELIAALQQSVTPGGGNV